MKKATKSFLSLRKDCALVNVNLKNYRGAKTGDCWQNVLKYIARDKDRYAEVSGWLVGDEFEKNGTAFISHFWVYDKLKNIYFDVTPRAIEDFQNYEYINDDTFLREMGIVFRITNRFILPPPILLDRDGSFYVCKVAIGNTITSHKIIEKFKTSILEVQHLFSLVF